ncbi:MAG: DUF3726 domain-containing protein [Pseudomonadota bacterium]
MKGARDLSLGEAEALIANAARGAGYPWGLAAEAGAAARRLIASGAPGAELFAAFLTSVAEDGIGARCPLREGLHAADLGEAPTGPCRWPEVRLAAADPDLSGPETRCAAPEAALAALEALAAGVYAPATEESRRRGAG